MSRTVRRNKKHLIRSWCGRVCDVDSYDRHRYGGKTDSETYARRVHWFTGDNHPGTFSPPGWWVRLNFNRPDRMREKAKLRRHSASGDWDNHTPENRARGAGIWF